MNTLKLSAAILFGGLLLLGNGGMTPALALLAQHDCSFCHDFHGAISNAGLLKATSSEAVCLNCHNVAINDTKAAAVHNPLNLASNQSGYITCRECHNPHDNVAGNDKLVGYKYDPQTGQRFVNPTIRVETTVSPPPYPTYKTVTFTGSADFNKGTGTGSCEICHSGNHHVGEDCTGCHGHDNGFVASCAGCHGSPPPTNAHLKHAGTGAGEYAYDCALCHPGDHDGTAADIAFTGIAATWAGATYSAAQKQCSNLYCHGSATADWDAGTGGACGDCHGAAGSGRPDGVNEPPGGNHLTTSHQVACVNCHTHDGTSTTEHVNGPTNANGDALVSAAGTSVDSYTYAGSAHATSPDTDGYKYTGGTCANTCHSNQVWGGTMSCTDCHIGSGGGAKDVSSSSPHVKVGKAGGYDAFVACTECHNGHANGVTGANDVEIPTTLATFNYKYGGHAGGKIQLGGAKTSGNSEAEICWNCHQNDTYQGVGVDISEWDGSHATYNYGNVTANNLNWLTTSWSSAVFSYKNGRLSNKPTVADPVNGTADGGSTHGVMGGSDGVDLINEIGCSACHDVHDTGGAPNTGTGPFLRGSWTQNPFPEDGAPRAGVTFTAVDSRGAVPRGGRTPTNQLSGGVPLGGWQIEQNNSTFSWTDYATGAGLCNECHPASNIETATTWTGHNAVVPSFGGTDPASDIFNVSKRMNTTKTITLTGTDISFSVGGGGKYYINSTVTNLRQLLGLGFTVTGSSVPGNNKAYTMFDTTIITDRQIRVNQTVTASAAGPSITLKTGTIAGSWAYAYPAYVSVIASRPGSGGTTWVNGLRNSNNLNDGINPKINTQPDTSQMTAHAFSAGNVTTLDLTGTTPQAGFHSFPCAKCHNPHASRLPKLMITNCLDVKVNNWDDQGTGTVGYPSSWGAAGNQFASDRLAYSPTTNNCHRRVESSDPNSEIGAEAGWNSVTPW